jgi:hypothetical protein
MLGKLLVQSVNTRRQVDRVSNYGIFLPFHRSNRTRQGDASINPHSHPQAFPSFHETGIEMTHR